MGYNTLSLVNEALKLQENARKKHNEYNQVWCVFDKDVNSDAVFNDAISLARKNKMGVAYSHQCFELWFFLHFDYLKSKITPNQYTDKLAKYLKHPYDKTSANMFEELKNKQKDAIKRATQLYNSYTHHNNPAINNPCTTVHELVIQLNKLGKE